MSAIIYGAVVIVSAVVCFIAALFAAWLAGVIVWGILNVIVTILASPILLADWVSGEAGQKVTSRSTRSRVAQPV